MSWIPKEENYADNVKNATKRPRNLRNPPQLLHIFSPALSEKFSQQFQVTNGKKHPKNLCIKDFGGTLAGGSRRGFRRPNSLCRCWFSQQNTVHKEFRGGGSKGVLGAGSKVQFWGPISLCLCAFWGLDQAQNQTFFRKFSPQESAGIATQDQREWRFWPFVASAYGDVTFCEKKKQPSVTLWESLPYTHSKIVFQFVHASITLALLNCLAIIRQEKAYNWYKLSTHKLFEKPVAPDWGG